MAMSEEEAIKCSTLLVNYLSNMTLIEKVNIDQINYRLGHDDDRQKSNYFIKNENGHVNNKKCKIDINHLKEEADKLNEQFRTTDGE